MWAALIVFASAEACGAYSDTHRLQDAYPLQCIRLDPATHEGLEIVRPQPRPTSAPATSIRPQPRPEVTP
jgi:hypothetical protein